MGHYTKIFTTHGSDGSTASSTKSYHNGGVEGDSFAKWYDQNLASHFASTEDHEGGTKGSGSGGTKGSGSGGTTGSGSGGTKGSGSGGTKGSGSGGTKGSGSGGTKGSGSGGTKGSGSGGTKGSGSGGTKGSGSGGTKGSGSGGTKGSGSGGTKGSGSGGTKGSGSGGTKGSGSGGTKGSGSGGTMGTPPDDGKTTYNYQMGDGSEIDVDVTMTPEGSLFFVVRQSDFEDEPADIDGILFNVADDSALTDLVVYPDENNTAQGDLTDLQVDANSVTELSNGAGDGNAYDVGLQFGAQPGSVEGQINQTNFTLSSGDGTPLTFDDIDLNSMKVIVNSQYDDGAVLGVTDSDDPNWTPADAVDSTPLTTDDVMGLMTQHVGDEDDVPFEEEYGEDDLVFM